MKRNAEVVLVRALLVVDPSRKVIPVVVAVVDPILGPVLVRDRAPVRIDVADLVPTLAIGAITRSAIVEATAIPPKTTTTEAAVIRNEVAAAVADSRIAAEAGTIITTIEEGTIIALTTIGHTTTITTIKVLIFFI